MTDLEKRLRTDLIKIGLVEDFTLSLRPYSKTYFGRYDVSTSTVILYVNQENGTPYPYKDLLMTTIHEVIHCKQWHSSSYKRVRGVMHDAEFKRLYNMYSNRAKARILFREAVSSYAFLYQAGLQQVSNLYSGAC